MRRALVAAGLTLLAGCADLEPFDPPVAGEINPGPGLFTGPSGEFVLFRSLGDAPVAGGEGAEAPPSQPPPPPPRRRLTDPPPE